MAFEKCHSPRLGDLFIGLAHDRTHISFVLFVGTVNIEVLKPRNAIEPTLLLSQQIELVLGPTVEVERFELLNVFVPVVHAPVPITIRRGRRGIDEADAIAQGPFAKFFRVKEVVVEQIVFVGFRGT